MDGDNIFGVGESVDVSSVGTQSTSDAPGTTNDTAGDVGSSNNDSNAPQGGQGEENNNTLGSSDNTGGQDPQPGVDNQDKPLILGKFKTEDDLKKSFNALARKIEAENGTAYGSIKPTSENLEEDYQNLQAYHTQMRQNKKSADLQNADAVARKDNQQQEPEVDENQLAAWYQDMVQTDPLHANAVLAKYLADKEIKQFKAEVNKQISPIISERKQELTKQNISTKFPDIQKYSEGIKEEIQAIMEESPELADNPDNDIALIEKAYYRAKVKALENASKQAFENGKSSADAIRNEKKSLGNEKPGAKPNNQNLQVPEGINIIPRTDGIFF